jgi:hypothetical protein
MGSTLPRLTLFIEGSTQSIRCSSLLRTTPQRLYLENLARRLRQIFRQQTKCCDLNLNLGRQPNKKITSDHPDGKHDLQAPTSYKIRSLANHFAKTTKYMTEESERYMDYLKLQAIYNLTGSRIQGGASACDLIGSRIRTQDKYTTRPEPPGAVTTTYSAEAEHVARLLLASGP